jgi:hypothetical protein
MIGWIVKTSGINMGNKGRVIQEKGRVKRSDLGYSGE